MKLMSCQIDAQGVRSRLQMEQHQERIEAVIEQQLGQEGADLLLLPELSTMEYSDEVFENLNELTSELDGPVVNAMSSFAKRINSAISFGMPRMNGTKRHISQIVVNRNGEVISHYDKIHIAQFGASSEKPYFTGGNHVSIFELDGFRFGTIICYDMRFGEYIGAMIREHNLDVILHPVAFYQDGSFASWRHFVGTRALENQVYFVSTNRAGQGWGYSMFAPPWFEQESDIDRFDEGETCKIYQLNRDVISNARETYPLSLNRLDDYREVINSIR